MLVINWIKVPLNENRMAAGQEKFVMISDLEGWGYSNIDIRSCIAALSILQVNLLLLHNL